MKIPTFKCPHCGNNLGTAVNAYLYGSPLRTCNKCKKNYVDNRYHEIAIEGIRQEDINPSEEDKKNNRKTGWKAIGFGVAMLALFIIIICAGWIVYPLPFVGVVSIIGGIGTLRSDSQKELEKTRKTLEMEKQQSFMRMQDPQYVEQLRAIGYTIPTPAPPQQKVCAACETPVDETVRFCPNCGKEV